MNFLVVVCGDGDDADLINTQFIIYKDAGLQIKLRPDARRRSLLPTDEASLQQFLQDKADTGTSNPHPL